jgi:hypothetical protein
LKTNKQEMENNKWFGKNIEKLEPAYIADGNIK